MRLYALHDSDPELRESRGAFELAEPGTLHSALAWSQNLGGYGIFWVLNEFKGRRLAKNLTKIRYWFCELDEGTKEEQRKRIDNSPLIPTFAVESKNGYHCYWKALDATPENWKRIVRFGIVPALGADPKATDPLRLLRCPGYLHLKDPRDPFEVKLCYGVYGGKSAYTEEQMLRAFPEQGRKTPARREPRPDGTFWQRVASLDGREALRRLSGHWLCKGESFLLVEQENGNANILRECDNYSTGCWVWEDGRLGGVKDGSSVAAWCRWYGWGWAEVARGLKEVFPELEKHEEAKEEASPAGA